MNIPEDVQQAVEQAFIWAYDSFRDASGCPKGDDICDVAYAIWQRWLESQPEAPETVPEETREVIPEDIRQAILICCSWAELYGHKVEEDAAYAVMEWLDAQTDAPAPDWRNAPDEATHHVYTPYGIGYWAVVIGDKCPVVSQISRGLIAWGWKYLWHLEDSGLVLPLGIDWRTTLRERPQS